jgi:PAS domain S-box-containing protein
MIAIQKTEDASLTNTNQDLILGLTFIGEIIQFNTECERLTGYRREEVLHKKFNEILVPNESIEQWKTALDSVQQTLWVDNFVLPLKTKDNQMKMIRWTGCVIKDEQGSVKHICIFGKPLDVDTQRQQSLPIPSPVDSEQHEEPPEQVIMAEPMPKRDNNKMPMKHGRKKIMFAREKDRAETPGDTPPQEDTQKPMMPLRRMNEKTSQKLDTMNESLKDLTRKYNTIIRRLDELEKKHSEKEKKDSYSKPQQLFETPQDQSVGNEKISNQRTDVSNKPLAEQEHHRFFSDPFGFKRQHKELDAEKQQLELRTQELEGLQTQLQKEQSVFNTRVEDFSRWREKLELLESAIEKRRQELVKQEDSLLEKSTSTVTQRTTSNEQEIQGNIGQTISQYNETVEKIPQSAAIIQRGILKQINTSFLDLLGYTTEEIVEKSFFDFIALEGLADVEKYYLDRLKGDNVSEYKTVFSTKDNHKISVEVNIKQTIYNGEKAEIAIITRLEPHPVS